jgi:hypothetical protein
MAAVDAGLLVFGGAFLLILGAVCFLSRRLDVAFYFAQIVFSLSYIYIDSNYINNGLIRSFASDMRSMPGPTMVMWAVNVIPMIAAAVYAVLNLAWIVKSDPVGRIGSSRSGGS